MLGTGSRPTYCYSEFIVLAEIQIRVNYFMQGNNELNILAYLQKGLLY